MMGTREPLKGGAEFDALRHGAKRYHFWRAQARRRIKAGFWRRVRKQHRIEAAAL